MRQRKVKDLETKMQAVSDWLVENPVPGVWRQVFADGQTLEPIQGSGRALYLEIGCGKGDFLLQQALAHPENNYIGIEGQDSVVLRAMEKAAKMRSGDVSEEDPEWMRAAADAAESAGTVHSAEPAGTVEETDAAESAGTVHSAEPAGTVEETDAPKTTAGTKAAIGPESLDNIRFACAYVNGLDELFDPGSLAGIYLNFSDPWPKARHAKRRLTYRGRLQDYAKALQPGGFIAIKTDNDGLFTFTLEEIEACGWIPEALTWDLHRTGNRDVVCNLNGNDANETGAACGTGTTDGTGAVCGTGTTDGIRADCGTGTEPAEEDQPLREARQTMTEYEKKFHAAGKPIHYVKVVI